MAPAIGIDGKKARIEVGQCGKTAQLPRQGLQPVVVHVEVCEPREVAPARRDVGENVVRDGNLSQSGALPDVVERRAERF